MGKIGGKLGTTGGFGQGEVGRKRASEAGRIGGRVSRRPSKKVNHKKVSEVELKYEDVKPSVNTGVDSRMDVASRESGQPQDTILGSRGVA